MVDGIVGAALFAHMGYEAKKRIDGGAEFTILQFSFIVDVFSSVPGMIHMGMILPGLHSKPQYLFMVELMRACCVVRVFKPDRYLQAFAVMKDILSDHRAVLE